MLCLVVECAVKKWSARTVCDVLADLVKMASFVGLVCWVCFCVWFGCYGVVVPVRVLSMLLCVRLYDLFVHLFVLSCVINQRYVCGKYILSGLGQTTDRQLCQVVRSVHGWDDHKCDVIRSKSIRMRGRRTNVLNAYIIIIISACLAILSIPESLGHDIVSCVALCRHVACIDTRSKGMRPVDCFLCYSCWSVWRRWW